MPTGSGADGLLSSIFKNKVKRVLGPEPERKKIGDLRASERAHRISLGMAIKHHALLVGLCVLASLGPTKPAEAHEDLVLVNYGGAAARAQMLALLRPWENATGMRAEMEEYNGGLDQIRRQIDAANVKWDVVEMEYSDVILACNEGLLEKIDPAILPPAPDGTPVAEDFRPDALHECGVGNIIWATVFAFDTNRFQETVPATMADFFNLEDFPGKRGIHQDPRGLLEWALMADGVAPADVYDTLSTADGIDRAFEKLESIQSSIVWWEYGDEPAKLLSDGVVTMSMAWNGRLYRPIVEQGQNIEIVWDSQIWEYSMYVIPKGSRNLQNAFDFVKYSTSTQKLADWTKYIPYGPSRISAMARVQPEILPLLPTFEENTATALKNNSQWWAENYAAILPRFEAFMAPKDTGEAGREDRF